MPSQTETLQTSVRAQTGTVTQMNEDLHAFFTLQGIPLGQLHERMIAYVRTQDTTVQTASAAWNYLLTVGVISALAIRDRAAAVILNRAGATILSRT